MDVEKHGGEKRPPLAGAAEPVAPPTGQRLRDILTRDVVWPRFSRELLFGTYVCWILFIVARSCGLFPAAATAPALAAGHGGPDDLSAAALESCAWDVLAPHASLLAVPPIARSEFLARQARLAAALDAAGVDAFIAEASASSAYYANISYTFGLSERPFLMILDRTGRFSYLVPKFEAGRVDGLGMVYADRKVIAWADDESPYDVLARETDYSKVMLDEHVRYMIAAGLQGVGIEVIAMSETIQSLRAVKTEPELVILRAINTFTLELVRSLQQCVRIDMTQETVVTSAHSLFTRGGVGSGFWSIVLFGDQAAYPHGGKGGKTLEEGEFVLVDIGSNLFDYGSDVTRTFLPVGATVSDRLMGIWNTVHEAQEAAFNKMWPDEMCSEVDAASRAVITKAGYGPYYTHRLGHGLGLEMHEHPFLNGANKERLKAGEVASNEPVCYPSACSSVRHTDMFRAST